MADARKPNSDTLGPNAWLVDDMFEQFRAEPTSVSESWREFFEGYKPGGANLVRRPVLLPNGEGAPNVGEGPNGAGPAGYAPIAGATAGAAVAGPGATATADGKPADSKVADSKVADSKVADAKQGPAVSPAQPQDGETLALRGSAARVVSNMTTSLGVPTATSFRVIPAKILEVNRLILNNQLARVGTSGKVSFTHLIAWAVVQAVRVVPAINSSFVETPGADAAGNGAGAPARAGGPAVFRPAHVNLGVAVDLEKSDGTRSLMVPVVQRADEADFRGFWKAYEDLVRKVRAGKGEVPDFVGATITITNPGTLGTVQSVPRLMAGQGAIVGVGTIDYPAEWQGADRRQLAELGVSKVVTLSSTYDHRVIQGAESGLFLQRAHKLLMGEDGFYEGVFRSMGVPYEPVRYNQDVNDPFEPATNYLEKQQKVDRLVNAYRVRGHLIAHLDPLDWKEPQMHAELDPATYGLTVWDLDREFLAQGLAGKDRMRLGEDPLAAKGRLLPYGRRRVRAHHGA